MPKKNINFFNIYEAEKDTFKKTFFHHFLDQYSCLGVFTSTRHDVR